MWREIHKWAYFQLEVQLLGLQKTYWDAQHCWMAGRKWGPIRPEKQNQCGGWCLPSASRLLTIIAQTKPVLFNSYLRTTSIRLVSKHCEISALGIFLFFHLIFFQNRNGFIFLNIKIKYYYCNIFRQYKNYKSGSNYVYWALTRNSTECVIYIMSFKYSHTHTHTPTPPPPERLVAILQVRELRHPELK